MMKLPISLIALATAMAVPSAASAQQADPERVAQMRCELLDICGDVAAAEEGREVETIDGQESRSGLMGSADIRAARRATTRAVSRPTSTRRVSTASNTRRVNRTRRVPTLSGGRGVTAAPAVQASQEIKEQVSGRAKLFVTFGTGSSVLTSDAKSEIASLVQVLEETKAAGQPLKLRIEGHASATGGEAINLPLSQKRAAAVREALVEAGVDEEQLVSEGFGSSQPIEGTKSTDRVNQRVEAVVID